MRGLLRAHPKSESILANISLFPNPAQDKLTVAWRKLRGKVAISILDLAGRTLISAEGIPTDGEGIYSLDIAKLPNAVYFLRLESGTQRGTVKFVKQ